MKNHVQKVIYLLLIIVIIQLSVYYSYALESSICPTADEITVINNVGKPDIVNVSQLSVGDIIKVYNSPSGGKLLGTSKMLPNKTEAPVSISQLGTNEGSVYVTVTSTGRLESERTKANFAGEPKSLSIDINNIAVFNNVDSSDTVVVADISGGDTIKVYNAEKGGKLIGSGKLNSYKSEIVIKVSSLGKSAGSVYVTLTSEGMLESDRTKADFEAEPVSEPLNSDNILITNNSGKADAIDISELNEGDTVKVYNSSAGGKLLGSAVVPITKTYLTISVQQVGTSAGSVYISVTGKGMAESSRTKVDFEAEAISDSANEDSIIVTNNAGIADNIYVSGLSSGDVVKIYNMEKGGRLLGSAAVPSLKSEVTASISQLGTSAGSIYITITSVNKRESKRIKVDYPSEAKSSPPSVNNVIITNNARNSDTIKVAGLTSGDVVRVYDADKKGKLLGTATVSGTSTDVTVTISQIGSDGGSVYISVKGRSTQESDRIKVDYKEESKTDIPYVENISVTNNARTADIIKVTGLLTGDVVKVYDKESLGNFLGSATAVNNIATITISQIGTGAGSVYISVSNTNKNESDRIRVSYSAEPVSSIIDINNITISNNVGKADTIKVTGVSTGDTVRAYDKETLGNLLGSAVVSTSSTEVTISVSQLGTEAGSIYISITSPNKQEGDRIKADYKAEYKSNDLDTGNITVINNAKAADTIDVTGLSAGDVIRVYDSSLGGILLGSAIVTGTNNFVAISIPQLGTTSGSVYISLTSNNKQESKRIKTDYKAESISKTPNTDNITIINNSKSADSVIVSGLSSGDLVKVYDSESSGNILGSSTVTLYNTEATISISQIGTEEGFLYISVTSPNQQESLRTKAAYNCETVSNSPAVENITVVNNAKAADTVKVTGLYENDTVKVYNSSKAGIVLGSAVVPTGGTDVTITIKQLGTTAGSVYVSITSAYKQESARTKADYTSEYISVPPSSENVSITNNAKASDLIYVSGLYSGDMVIIYDTPTGGNILGQATVSTYNNEVSITIHQLGQDAGSVYISATNINKQESSRTKVDFTAEAKSDPINADNITIINNARTSDTVTVTRLSPNDTIKVYNEAKGGNLIGTATVPDDRTEVVITIKQIGTDSGSVYISRAGMNKHESDRAKADFLNEMTSNEPNSSNISVINKVGIPSTVTVTKLMGEDIIKVYDSEIGGNMLGSGVVDTYYTEATVSVSQLGAEAGYIYVSVTSRNKLESKRTKAAFSAKEVSEAPNADYIFIENNALMADCVTMMGLNPNDIIKVYDSPEGGNILGLASVPSGSTSATVSITQLGTKSGKVYVSLTSVGKSESTIRTEVAFAAEGQSDTPSSNNISIYNNVGISDSIRVSGLLPNDIVKVYRTETSQTPLSYSEVLQDGSEAVVYIKQLGVASGSVYITITSVGKKESDRVMAEYVSESFAPDSNNIYIVNNAVIADTVTVTGLAPNDVVKVYDSAKGGYLLGTAIVSINSTQAIVAIPQLTSSAGIVYVSVTSFGRCESGRTEVQYLAEQSSNALYSGNVEVINNSVTADIITVKGLSANDFIRVYNSLSGDTLIGSATVSAGNTHVSIPVAQLGVDAGNIYISVTNLGKTESTRTKVYYIAEN